MNLQRIELPEDVLADYRDRQSRRLKSNLRVSLAAGVLIALFYLPWGRWHDSSNDLPTIELGLALAAGMLAFLAATYAGDSQRRIELIALLACLFALSMATLLLVTLPDGFLFGVGTLLSYTVITTVLSSDLTLPVTVTLAVAYLLIPNLALTLIDASWLIVMNTNWLLVSGGLVAVGLAYMTDQSHRHEFLLEHQLAAEKDRGEALLGALLPAGVAHRLQESTDVIADVQPDATVLFADLVGFTKLSKSLPPEELISLLNTIFTTLDELAVKHGLEKIKTIGDSYMVAAGVADAERRTCADVAAFGLDSIAAVQTFSSPAGDPLGLRVGMATGQVICGVIGRRRPYFDLWGPTVNLASRLESSAPAGFVQVDDRTARILGDQFLFEPCGPVMLPGIGPVATQLILERVNRLESGRTDRPEQVRQSRLNQPVLIGRFGALPHSEIEPS